MIDKIVKFLKSEYSGDEFATKNKRDPFRVLVSCLISLRTKDEVTFEASKRLYKLADSPKKMMNLDVRKIEKAIYPAGFYKTKAKRIKEISKRLVEEHKSKVPSDIDELMKFNGVGRKTANIVITFGYDKPGIAVDTHVHRISNRLGFVNTQNPHDTEFALRKKLPKKYWIVFNELIVRHGQNTCKPIGPKCFECGIKRYCKKVGVDKRYWK